VTTPVGDATIEAMLPDRLLVQRLLAVMDQKHHWAYPYLTRPGLSRPQHLQHFKHEYLVYVRDFPELLAQAARLVPSGSAFDAVRVALDENILEERTGKLSGTAPHAELFLRMMEGLGFPRAAFDDDDAFLHPAARSYRDWLRAECASGPWQRAVSLLTIWVEGSTNERAELAGEYVRPRGEDAVRSHALVVHYGCPPTAMQLVRAHGDVEGGHREDAWRMVLEHVSDEGDTFKSVVETCQSALARWHRYRDGVAERMGLCRDRAA
jgi:pyrroloquinoline-quinone synthase